VSRNALTATSKVCTKCKIEKDLDSFHKCKHGKYGRVSRCKECLSEMNKVRYQEKRELIREQTKNYYYNNREKHIELVMSNPKRLENRRKLYHTYDGYIAGWQKNNPEKLKEYRLNRGNKKHNISKEEWDNCKSYFNDSCAYCGLSENEHYELYDQQLHKEHVDHEGSNDLSNCVPACKICNSSKREYSLIEWYEPTNTRCFNYNHERMDRINRWLIDDHKLYIEPNNLYK